MKKIIIILLVFLMGLTACSSKTIKTEVADNVVEEQVNTDENIMAKEENKESNEVEPADSNNEIEKKASEVENTEDEKNVETVKTIPVENKTQESNVSETNKDSDDEDSNRIKIQGLVETELSLTLEELKKMDDLIFEGDFYSLNSFGTTGYTHFKGINLWKLLELKAIISTAATKVTVIAQDGYKMEFTVNQVKKQDYMDETNPDNIYPMIIAWEENEEEYDSEEGAPFKLVVGQKQAGDVNKPQWVSNIDKIVIE
ncbi:MAG: molybdopterin-dependent oxidoreductase [Sedimentibacter sp.]